METERTARIRVTEETASLIEMLLREDRRASVHARRIHIEGGAFEATHLENAHIRLVDFVLEEVERTQIEQGWRHWPTSAS
jgi:hypothetical protein